MVEFGKAITAVDAWLDGDVSQKYKDQPLAQDWARLSKVQEELGEATDAFISYTHQNPRKPARATLPDVLQELSDTAWTAVLAIQHFTKDSERTCQILDDDLDRLYSRIPGQYRIGADLAEAVRADRPRVVTLCGSTRFHELFREANLQETLAGNIVLSIGCDFKSDADLAKAGELGHDIKGAKLRLDELHFRKIDISDEILVLNQDGYIGDSTRREIAYAESKGKKVRFWETDLAGPYEAENKAWEMLRKYNPAGGDRFA